MGTDAESFSFDFRSSILQILKIVGEITDWEKQTPGELQKWRERLADNKGEIIN